MSDEICLGPCHANHLAQSTESPGRRPDSGKHALLLPAFAGSKRHVRRIPLARRARPVPDRADRPNQTRQGRSA